MAEVRLVKLSKSPGKRSAEPCHSRQDGSDRDPSRGASPSTQKFSGRRKSTVPPSRAPHRTSTHHPNIATMSSLPGMLPGGRPMGSMGAGMPGQNPQGMSEQEQAMVKAVRMKSFLAVLSFCALRKELDCFEHFVVSQPVDNHADLAFLTDASRHGVLLHQARHVRCRRCRYGSHLRPVHVQRTPSLSSSRATSPENPPTKSL